MQKSLRENGLLSPIAVRIRKELGADGRTVRGQPVLVYGATRLAAAKREGREEIEAEILEGTEIDFLKAEIVENLHRGELTKLEQAEQLAAYEKLIREEARSPEQENDAVLPEEDPGNDLLAASCRKKIGHRPRGSIDRKSRRTAARELNADEKALRRAGAINRLPAEVKDAARAAGLDDNQSALLAVAAKPTTEDQLAKVEAYANRKPEPRTPVQLERRSSSIPSESATDQIDDQVAAIRLAWSRACSVAKQRAWPALRDEMIAFEKASVPIDLFPLFRDRRKSPLVGSQVASEPSQPQPSLMPIAPLTETPASLCVPSPKS
jgi:ParB family chromosome partitioning protein